MFGYRAFKVTKKDGQKRLCAIFKDYEYAEGRQAARCIPSPLFNGGPMGGYTPYFPESCLLADIPNKHAYAGTGSGCGFYFYRVPENPVQLAWLQPIIYGLIWASGKIVEHEDGVCRCQFMSVLALAGSEQPDFDAPFFKCDSFEEAVEKLEQFKVQWEKDNYERDE